MKRYFDDYGAMPDGSIAHVAPGATGASTTHGGFDDNPRPGSAGDARRGRV